jgi:hypothetical protein
VVKSHHQKSRQVQMGMKMEMERMGQMRTETMPKRMEVLCHHLDRLKLYSEFKDIAAIPTLLEKMML